MCGRCTAPKHPLVSLFKKYFSAKPTGSHRTLNGTQPVLILNVRAVSSTRGPNNATPRDCAFCRRNTTGTPRSALCALVRGSPASSSSLASASASSLPSASASASLRFGRRRVVILCSSVHAAACNATHRIAATQRCAPGGTRVHRAIPIRESLRRAVWPAAS